MRLTERSLAVLCSEAEAGVGSLLVKATEPLACGVGVWNGRENERKGRRM